MSPEPGLCGACLHRKVVETRKGSRFWLCRRSESDPRYPRYPGLPVLSCPGFEPDRASRSEASNGGEE